MAEIAEFADVGEEEVAMDILDRSDIKLFGKWALDEVQVSDISLQVCPHSTL